MGKCIKLGFILAVLASGCVTRDTLDEIALHRQYNIIQEAVWNETGVWSARKGERSITSGVWDVDLDNDGIKEILIYVMYSGGMNYWWLWYYKNRAWHEMSDTPFMQAGIEETYHRHQNDMSLPRMFKRRGDLVEAVIFDRNIGTVTFEPFDYEEFESLRKKGLLIYEDVGQDDEQPPPWECYVWHDGGDRQPRLFLKKPGEDVVEALFMDRMKAEVRQEPFDFQEFDELRKQGIIKPAE